MNFEEAKQTVLNGEAFDFCIWREIWPNKGPDDCPCVMKDYNGELYVYPSPFFDDRSVDRWQLTDEDLAADDWVGENG